MLDDPSLFCQRRHRCLSRFETALHTSSLMKLPNPHRLSPTTTTKSIIPRFGRSCSRTNAGRVTWRPRSLVIASLSLSVVVSVWVLSLRGLCTYAPSDHMRVDGQSVMLLSAPAPAISSGSDQSESRSQSQLQPQSPARLISVRAASRQFCADVCGHMASTSRSSSTSQLGEQKGEGESEGNGAGFRCASTSDMSDYLDRETPSKLKSKSTLSLDCGPDLPDTFLPLATVLVTSILCAPHTLQTRTSISQHLTQTGTTRGDPEQDMRMRIELPVSDSSRSMSAEEMERLLIPEPDNEKEQVKGNAMGEENGGWQSMSQSQQDLAARACASYTENDAKINRGKHMTFSTVTQRVAYSAGYTNFSAGWAFGRTVMEAEASEGGIEKKKKDDNEIKRLLDAVERIEAARLEALLARTWEKKIEKENVTATRGAIQLLVKTAEHGGLQPQQKSQEAAQAARERRWAVDGRGHVVVFE